MPEIFPSCGSYQSNQRSWIKTQNIILSKFSKLGFRAELDGLIKSNDTRNVFVTDEESWERRPGRKGPFQGGSPLAHSRKYRKTEPRKSQVASFGGCSFSSCITLLHHSAWFSHLCLSPSSLVLMCDASFCFTVNQIS